MFFATRGLHHEMETQGSEPRMRKAGADEHSRPDVRLHE